MHRDIKPQNLMVSPEGRVRLCDFGIAHLMVTTTELTAAGSSLGTPSYMAPEQFRAEPIGEDHPPNNGELPKGASYQACALFLAPTGDTVAGVEWVQSQTDLQRPPRSLLEVTRSTR